MKVKFYSLIIFLFINSLAFSQISVSGTVTDNNQPVVGAIVSVKDTSNGTTTDMNGKYILNDVNEDDVLIFSNTGFSDYKVNVNKNTSIDFDFNNGKATLKAHVNTATNSVSPNNYWIGAKIGYNFIGETDDNFFVGSASIAMNVLEGLPKQHKVAIVGNFGNFKFDKDTNDSENVQKVAQSLNGLSVGLGYTHESKNPLEVTNKSNLIFRQFIQTGVRLTSFKNVGDNDETVDLAQSVTTTGLELELNGFKNDGAVTLSTGISMYLFDPNVYQKIFDNDKKGLLTLDFTVILPISKNMGFFINGTFAKQTSANYILGIIFQP